jgi:hypothetical protein
MSSPDAATRSRFVHTLIATSRRRRQGEANAALFRTMTANANHLHMIGRYLMDNRKAFNESFTSLLSIWTREQLAITDDRTRFVHGAAWAAFMALAEILNINVNVQAFTSYTVQHSNLAFEDVHDETMANRFWTDVVSAINRGNIDRRLFDEKTITLNPEGAYDPGSGLELSGATQINSLFLSPNEVFDMYALDIRKRGDTAALSKNDIQREISKEEYWIEPAGKCRVHRATLNGHRYNGVWVINLAKFPFAEQLKDALDADGSTAGT